MPRNHAPRAKKPSDWRVAPRPDGRREPRGPSRGPGARGALRRAAQIVALLSVAAGSQCAPAHDDAASNLPTLSSSLVRDIALEAGDGPVMTRVNDLAVDSTGNLFVLDAAGHLHKYDVFGNYVALLSDTAGKAVFLRQPAGILPDDVAVGRDGHIYVTGAPANLFPRRLSDTAAVSRISPDLAIDAVYRIPRTETLTELVAWRDNLIVALARPGALLEEFLGYSEEQVKATEKLLAMSHSGTPTMYFHPADEREESVPYWGSWFVTHVAEAGDELLAVNSLYPIYRYDYEWFPIDTFGGASPSFRQPSRPALGSFPTAGPEYYEWRNSFTTIGGIHVLADSLVVVVLVDQIGNMPNEIERTYRADVFDLNSGKVVARDVALEGEVLHADTLLYMAWRPTDEGWHVGLFDLVEEGPR